VKKQALLLSAFIASSIYAQSVTLDEAINIALENNKNMKISDLSLRIANTLYNQAMSAHYPTLDASISAIRLDEPVTFEMIGTTTVDNTATKQIYSNAANIATLGGDATTAATLNGYVSGMSDTTSLPIEMEVEVMGRDTATAQLDFVLPIYTGGKISALVEQAKLGKSIAQEGKVRTRNQVIYDVKKYYYGAIVAKQIKQLTSDTLDRMSFIRDLTSQMYKGGSMSVKKTDYLRSKLSVSMIEVFYEDIKAKEMMAKSALANAMGYTYEKEIEVTDAKLPTPMMDKSIDMMVQKAYEFNPDYNTLKLAIKVQNAKVDEARSAYLPQAAFTASATHMYNDYEYGVINDTNRNSWSIGIGLQWSLFNGMRTTNEVQQRKLEKMKMQDQEILLKDGLALQIKQSYIDIQSTYNKYKILTDAVEVAKENRDLNTRAYQADMVKTKDVIESQLFEAITQADFYRCQNEHALAQAKADLIVGKAIENYIKE
jgi:outer membrane protein TolC